MKWVKVQVGKDFGYIDFDSVARIVFLSDDEGEFAAFNVLAANGYQEAGRIRDPGELAAFRTFLQGEIGAEIPPVTHKREKPTSRRGTGGGWG